MPLKSVRFCKVWYTFLTKCDSSIIVHICPQNDDDFNGIIFVNMWLNNAVKVDKIL